MRFVLLKRGQVSAESLSSLQGALAGGTGKEPPMPGAQKSSCSGCCAVIMIVFSELWPCLTHTFSGQAQPRLVYCAPGHAEVLLEAMEEASVSGALIIQPGNHKFDHSYVTSVLKAYPDKFAGMLLANPAEVRRIDQSAPFNSHAGASNSCLGEGAVVHCIFYVNQDIDNKR